MKKYLKLSFGVPKLSFRSFGFLLAFFWAGLFLLAAPVQAEEYTAVGEFASTDLLSGVSDEAWITGFSATTSLPAGTSIGFLFSVDGENWYNQLGEKGVWDMADNGANYFDLRALKWATTTLATTSLRFYYTARLETADVNQTPSLLESGVEYSSTFSWTDVEYGYTAAGEFASTDLLAGVSDEAWITGFSATTSLPAGTSIGFLFSVDGLNWYNQLGEKGVWDMAADGANYFDLRALKWATTTLSVSSLNFYYLARLETGDSALSPSLLESGVEYSSTFSWTDIEYGYAAVGEYESNVLVAESADEIQYFGYLADLPALTAASIMFSNDGVTFYSSTGTPWQWTALADGDHLASSTDFDLQSLGWHRDLYYRIRLTTTDESATPSINEVKAYFTERPPVEFISIIDPDNAVGTDYTSLYSWEAAVQSDLTASTTLVYSYATSTRQGILPDGSLVVGETSGATGTLVHLTGTTSPATAQALVRLGSGRFQKGEKLYLQSAPTNFVYLTTSGDSVIAIAQCRSTGGTADTDDFDVYGWTTSPTNYIKIWTDPTDPYGRHLGKWDDTKYRLETSDYNNSIDALVNNVIIEGLQIAHYENYHYAIVLEGPDENGVGTARNNILKSTGVFENGGIIAYNNSDGIFYIHGNIIYGFYNGIETDGASYVYNNNVIDVANVGIQGQEWRNVYAANNIVENSGAYDFYPNHFRTGTGNNISSDGTAPGINSKINTSARFVDSANKDYRLSPEDTVARDFGTSTPLSTGTSLDNSVMYDIQGTLRGSAWDIGADELTTEFVSTICETRTSGGDCASLDYQSLYQWEDKVETNLTATSTRVFSGSITGVLNENDLVYFLDPTQATSSGRGYIVATTSDQILIDGIISSSSLPIIAVASGTIIRKDVSNYWRVQGATTTDALGASPIAVAKIDGGWVNADDERVNVADWGADIDNYIKIYTSDTARHHGKWTDDKYRMIVSDVDVLEGSVPYVRIDGLQVQVDPSYRAIEMYPILPIEGEVYISNNIVRAMGPGSDTKGIMVVYVSDSFIFNNIVYGIIGSSLNPAAIDVAASDSTIYNNTVYNSSIGIFREGSASLVLKNNLIASTTDPFYGTFHASSTHNATDINDTPDGSTGTNYVNQTFSFVSTASGTEDFHITIDDTGAKDKGIDLSSDTVYAITTDIDGNTRPFDSAYDIGADEFSIYTVYRSVGPGATAALDSDNSGADTLSISTTSSSATFEVAVPDNVGVGDAIIYDSDGDNDLDASDALVFIAGRSSSTLYSIQNEFGEAPTIATTDNDKWAIYRAHTSLANAEAGTKNTSIPMSFRGGNLDLPAISTQWNIACYANGTTPDSTAVTISGWETSADYYLKVYTPVTASEVGVSQRHSGKWDEGKYRMAISNEHALLGGTDYTVIDGLQVSLSGSYKIALSGEDDSIVSNNIVTASNCTQCSGVRLEISESGRDNYAINNIVDGFTSGIVTWAAFDSVAHLYNNSVYNCYQGLVRQSGTGIVVNNISQNSTNADFVEFQWLVASNYNISSDATAPGTDSKTNTTVEFVDAPNKDFHLAPTDTTAINAGTTTVFTDIPETQYDIDGHYRRSIDIGADEASMDFVSTVMQSGGDFSTLSSWEAGVDSDLAATTTAVFSIASSSLGTFVPGHTFTGQSSGASGTLINRGSSSAQILLSAVRGSFILGETIASGFATSTLLSLGDPANAVAKIDGAWTVADTAAVTIDGWSTTPNNYVRIYTTPSARHQGKWDEGKYRLVTDVFYGCSLTPRSSQVSFSGLQISNSGANNICITNSGVFSFDSSIIKGVNSYNDEGGGIRIDLNGRTIKANIQNNIIYDTEYGVFLKNTGNLTGLCNNNTFYNNSVGIIFYSWTTFPNFIIANNISIDGYFFDHGAPIMLSNLSGDETADD